MLLSSCPLVGASLAKLSAKRRGPEMLDAGLLLTSRAIVEVVAAYVRSWCCRGIGLSGGYAEYLQEKLSTVRR